MLCALVELGSCGGYAMPLEIQKLERASLHDLKAEAELLELDVAGYTCFEMAVVLAVFRKPVLVAHMDCSAARGFLSD